MITNQINQKNPSNSIAFLGTASNVGKTLIATAFCRASTHLGYKVTPFKAVNITSNLVEYSPNRYIPVAQYLQSIACHKSPNERSCPIILSPNGENWKLYLYGEYMGDYSFSNYHGLENRFAKVITDSFTDLSNMNDFVIVEGSGAAYEPNLRKEDWANRWLVEKFSIPSILISDISYGGVFGSIVGQLTIMPQTFRDYIIGYIINNFSGDSHFLDDAIKFLKDSFHINCIGVVNRFNGIRLSSFDSLDLQSTFISCDKFDSAELEQDFNILSESMINSGILDKVLGLIKRIIPQF